MGIDDLTYSTQDMQDAADVLKENTMWAEARVMRYAAGEIERLQKLLRLKTLDIDHLRARSDELLQSVSKLEPTT